MKYRKLRIAWSVAWGVVGLLLVALWVRSDTRWDNPFGGLGQYLLQFDSLKGHLFLGITDKSPGHSYSWEWRTFRATSLTESVATGTQTSGATVRWPFNWKFGALGIGIVKSAFGYHVVMPYLLLVAFSATVAYASWVRWSSKLCTLLVAMTAAAIGLGWIFYAIRK